MTEYILALIPSYGLYLIFFATMLACFGIPLPSSIILITAGALAASGDFILWQIILVATLAYWVADQIVFNISKFAGPKIINVFRNNRKFAPLLKRSEYVLEKYGLFGVFLSRTILSPTGPIIGYLSGAMQMRWLKFSVVALPSSVLWILFYTFLGYMFTGNVPQISNLVASILVFSAALLSVFVIAAWLMILWSRFENDA